MTNNSNPKSGGNPMDAFTSFWTDYFAKMTPQPPAGQTAQQPEFIKQMQQSFFDAMSRSCTDFMRSDQFLQIMKQTMDNALAFREQMNKFLTSAAHGIGQPTLEDTNHLVQVVRNVEDRMNEKLALLNDRLDSIEQSLADGRMQDDDGDKNKRSAPMGAKSKTANPRS